MKKIIICVITLLMLTGCYNRESPEKEIALSFNNLNTIFSKSSLYRLYNESITEKTLIDAYLRKSFLNVETKEFKFPSYNSLLTMLQNKETLIELKNLESVKANRREKEEYLYNKLTHYITSQGLEYDSKIIEKDGDILKDDSFILKEITYLFDNILEDAVKLDTKDDIVTNVKVDNTKECDLNKIELLHFGTNELNGALQILNVLDGNNAIVKLQEINSSNSSIKVDEKFKLVYVEYSVTNIDTKPINLKDSLFYKDDDDFSYSMSGLKPIGLKSNGVINPGKTESFQTALIAEASSKCFYWYDNELKELRKFNYD